MKRLTWRLWMLIVLSLIGCVALTLSASAAPEGTAINTPAEFAAMAADGVYYLNADITLEASYAGVFSGTFDGNGKTVTITGPAMFTKVNNATLRNFTVVGDVVTDAVAEVLGAEDFAAAVAIIANGNSSFANITSNVNFTSTSGNTRYGAIAATSQTGYALLFEDCVNNGTINVAKYAGGIYGWTNAKGNATFRHCVNNGDITAGGYCSGIAARVSAAGAYDSRVTLEGCVNSGDITSTNEYCAGIYTYGLNYLIVTDCVNTGAITAANGKTGGIVGRMEAAQGTGNHIIHRNVNLGNVTNNGTGNTGGIVGYIYALNGDYYSWGDVQANVNYGTISSGGYVSQIVGYTNGNNSVIAGNVGAGSVVGGNANKSVFVGLSSGTVTSYDVAHNYYVENDGTVNYSWADNDANAANRIAIADRPAGTIQFVSAEQFANGEAAWKLNIAHGAKVFEVRDGKTVPICAHHVVDGVCILCGVAEGAIVPSTPAEGVAIDTVNFPDVNFRVYVGQFDTNRDCALSQAELAAVQTIEYVNTTSTPAALKIADLTGIAHFSALRVLHLNLNLLNVIDLSQNTALTEVIIDSNRLTSVRLANNPALTNLRMSGNYLTHLDLSSCTALTDLRVSGNELHYLDLRAQPALTWLYASDNKMYAVALHPDATLSTLSVGNNGTTLPYEDGGYHLNMLPSMDISRIDAALLTTIPAGLAISLSPDGMLTTDDHVTGATYTYRLNDNHTMKVKLTLQPNPAKFIALDGVNFPDSVFRKYIKKFDTDNDGLLSPTEREAVTTISIVNTNSTSSSNKVKDLTGVEHFPALTTLHLNYNMLNTVDLSKNPALTVVYLNNNDLTSINLSNNPALTEVRIDNNDLTSINLSNNPALTHLWLSGNDLTAIDLSSCIALTDLRISSNALTALDFSHNLALAYLSCSYNQLSVLDLTAQPALYGLQCDSNRLYAVALHESAVLTSKTWNYNYPVLDFSSGSFDLKTLPGFEIGRIMDFPNDDATVDANGILTVNPGVTRVAFNYRTNASLGMRFYFIIEAPDRYLPIDEANFPDANFRSYVKSIDPHDDGYFSPAELTTISSINVNKSADTADAEKISDLTGIEHFTEITTLYCNYNALTSLDVSHNTRLTNLQCHHNRLSTLDVSQLRLLTTLYCNNNQLTSLILPTTVNLKTLRCQVNQLTSLDLTKYTRLTSIHAQQNQLSSLLLPSTTTLNDLQVYENQLAALNLSNTPALTTLKVSRNALTNLDLTKHTKLKTLECTYNQLTSLNVSACTGLTKLHASENNITGVLDLTMLTKLTDLQLTGNGLWGYTVHDSRTTSAMTINSGSNKTKIALTDGTFNLGSLAGIDLSRVTLHADSTAVGVTFDATTGMLTVPPSVSEVAYTYRVNNNRTVKLYLTIDGGIAINETNFPDAIFRTYVTNRFDSIKKDNVLTPNEIAKATSISVSKSSSTADSQKIKTLKGIEYFTELTSLYCQYNALTELDLSQNRKLTLLQCYNNQISTLNIASCTGLRTLNCSNNPLNGQVFPGNHLDLTSLNCINTGVTSLDLSRNTALTNLYVGDDALSALDLSAQTNLKSLHCYRSPLYAVKLADNVTLENGTNGSWYSNIRPITLTGNTFDLSSLPGFDPTRIKSLPAGVTLSGNLLTVTACDGIIPFTYQANAGTVLRFAFVYDDPSHYIPLNAQFFPDANFLTKLTALDTSGDGMLSQAERAAVWSLDVSNSSTAAPNQIESLAGIEYFPFLYDLDFGMNKVTAFEPARFVELGRLGCEFNKLEALDVSRNLELNDLHCAGNKLTTLDVSQNLKLTQLRCFDNDLTGIDVSNNTKLTALYVGKQAMTSLDVSKNTALTALSLYDTNISSLNLSNNTKLQNLYCYDTKLNVLDLSLQKSLRTLNAKNTPLHTLLLHSNANLTTLDLTGCVFPLTVMNGVADLKQLGGLDPSKITSLSTVPEGMACTLVDGVLTVAEGVTQVNYVYQASSKAAHAVQLSFLISDPQDNIVINETNFPDSIFRTYVTNRFDANDDGVLSPDEIAKAVMINISKPSSTPASQKVTSLKGIEYFTALTALNCENNALTSLDLSQNRKMRVLQCNNNSIATLNISTCSELVKLFCADNPLNGQGVDPRNHPQLERLSCANIGLTSLDLSQNAVLVQLYVANNALTSLDLSHNPNLTAINCQLNPLTSLDLSAQTALTDLTCFRSTLCAVKLAENVTPTIGTWYSNIHPITLTGNTFNLSSLPGFDPARIKSLPAGVTLSGNLLTVTACDGIIPFTYQANAGTVLRFAFIYDDPSNYVPLNAMFFPDVNFLAKLTVLDTSGDGMLSQAERAAVYKLDVSNSTTIAPNQIESLAGIEYFPFLYDLDFGYNKVTAFDPTLFPELITLRCNRNLLTTLNVTQNPELVELNCSGNKLTVLDVSQNLKLRELRCFSNALTAINVSNNTKLTALYVGEQAISSLDVSANAALTSLSLYETDISSLDLTYNTKLKNLYCYNTKLNVLDLRAQSDLKVLNAQNTPLYALLLHSNANLTTLDLTGCVFTLIVENGVADLKQLGGLDLSKLTSPTAVPAGMTCSLVDGVLTVSEGTTYVNYTYAASAAHNITLSFLISDPRSYVAINEKFPDEIFRQYVLDYIDTDRDQKLSPPEMAAVRELDVTGLGIADLTGIEYFTGLTELEAGKNRLTGVDLSKNTALKQIELFNNYITSLDLRYNTALTDLDLNRNALMRLDLSANTALQRLRIANQQDPASPQKRILEELILGEKPALRSLVISSTLLDNGDFNLAAYPNLEFLNVSDTKITSLDVTQNSKLYFLACSGTEIASLNVTQNPLLEEINCDRCPRLTALDVSRNPLLVELFCQNSALTELNLANNPELLRLQCQGNHLRSLDLRFNQKLNSINCANQTLLDNVKPMIALYLGSMPQLTELNCSGNALQALELRGAPALNNFNCSNNLITALDLSCNPSLTTLNVSRNAIVSLDVRGLRLLATLNTTSNPLAVLYVDPQAPIQNYTQTQHRLDLELDENGRVYLGHYGINAMTALNWTVYPAGFKATLDANGWLTVDSIGVKTIGYQYPTGGRATLKVVLGISDKRNFVAINATNFPDEVFRTKVREMCDINQDGVLSNAELEAVTTLNVSSTGSAPAARRIRAFSYLRTTPVQKISSLTGIEHFPNLRELNCSGNTLTTLDISENPKLTVLECSNNAIETLDISANSNLTTLTCSNNQLTELSIGESSALTTLACGNNQLVALDVTECADLETLDCSANAISELTLGEKAVLTAVKCSDNAITTLDLQKCVNLETIDAENNTLSDLKVSEDTILKEVKTAAETFDLPLESGNKIGSMTIARQLNPKNPQPLDVNAIRKVESLTAGYRADMVNGDLVVTKTDIAAFSLEPDAVHIDVQMTYMINEYHSTIYNFKLRLRDESVLINETTFPDKPFRDHVAANLDTNKDGKLSPSEIEAVTSLSLHRGPESKQKIADLTGIAYFKNLTALDVSGNALRSLDLRGLPKLDLDQLNISGNTISVEVGDQITFSPDLLAGVPADAAGREWGAQGSFYTIAPGKSTLEYVYAVPLEGNRTIDMVVTIKFPTYLPGDIDDDGIVTTRDANLLLVYLSAPTKPFLTNRQEKLYNADAIGEIDLADLAKILELLRIQA